MRARGSPRREGAGGIIRGSAWEGSGRSRRGDGRGSVADPSSLLIHAVHQLLEGLVLELADALAGQAEVLADLAEGHRLERLEAEPHADHRGLAVLERLQAAEDAVEVVGLDHLVLRRLAPVV